jgi:hypothetical protein
VWTLVNNIKVFHQYTNLLNEAASLKGPHAAFLGGRAESCVNGMEWFAPLAAGIKPPKDAPSYRHHVSLWRASNPGLFCDAEAAFHVHQGYAVEDPEMTRFLVSQMKRDAFEYEAAIAGNILRARPASFDEFSREFTQWRKRGLYHTLCLAARHMPQLEKWVPKHLHHEAGDWEDLLGIFNASSFCSASRLSDVCERLADRSPALSNHICERLDRVAILTRVKSDDSRYEHFHPESATPSLDDRLAVLHSPTSDTSPYTHSLLNWEKLKSKLETTFPPSLLCPALAPPNRGVWGYGRLSLRMEGDDEDDLRIHRGRLTWQDRAQTKTQQANAAEAPESGPTRLQDILFRIGDVATSPELAHLMLFPESLMQHLEGDSLPPNSSDIAAVCKDRAQVIDLMAAGKLGRSADFFACINALTSHLPTVDAVSHPPSSPLRVLAWRLDWPSQAILYGGDDARVDINHTPPHLLPKRLTTDKLPKTTVSSISLIPSDVGPEFEDAHRLLRACVADTVLGPHEEDFSQHPLHRVPIKVSPGQTEIHTTTTLAEAVAVFAGPAPFHLSTVNLHESKPWEEDHIDTRYGERQVGDNGSRFRDWAVVYHDGDKLRRCRLAAHELTMSSLFHTYFPVARQEEQGTHHNWVAVASTLPTETRVLRHMNGKTELESLRKSVENRFWNDWKLLPVRQAGDAVDRSNMEVYTDEAAKQVALVYAPHSADGERRAFEMLSFRLQ